MPSQEVEHYRRKLACASTLGEDDVMRFWHIELRSDEGLKISYESRKGLRPMGEFGKTDTRVVVVEQACSCFLEDGDEVSLAAHACAPGFATIGFGSCRGIVTA